MNTYYLGTLPEFSGDEAGVFSEKPFIVLVETTLTETKLKGGATSTSGDYIIRAFDSLKAAKEFKTTRCNPDRQPETANIYAHSNGRWIKVAFEVE